MFILPKTNGRVSMITHCIFKNVPQFRKYGMIAEIGRIWKRKRVQADLGVYKIVRPGAVSHVRKIPDIIPKPVYYDTGIPGEKIDAPEIKTADQIACMRESCSLARMILNILEENVKVGITTDNLDDIAHSLCITNGAYPSPLFYMNFPKSICTSVNNVACHGIPDNRPLHNGDIINIDVTVYLNGYHGDCSDTFLVGDVDEKGKFLVESTKYCLDQAIKICGPGVPFSEIGTVIQNAAEDRDLNVCPSFLGHGIGQYFHGPPDIYHCSNDYPGVMKPGMTFTIEPVLTLGSKIVEILEDGWTAVTIDNSRTAQKEHTILITEKGCDILTL